VRERSALIRILLHRWEQTVCPRRSRDPNAEQRRLDLLPERGAEPGDHHFNEEGLRMMTRKLIRLLDQRPIEQRHDPAPLRSVIEFGR